MIAYQEMIKNMNNENQPKQYDAQKRNSMRQAQEQVLHVIDENSNPNVDNMAAFDTSPQRNRNRYRNPMNESSSPVHNANETDDYTNSMNKLSMVEDKQPVN